nr:hypothetical protein [Tanacetum cinerariifolium]
KKSKKEDVNIIENMVKNVHDEKFVTPPKTHQKTWNVEENVIKVIRSTANKFAILQEVEEEGLSLKLYKKEKEEDGRYAMMKLKPSFSATKCVNEIEIEDINLFGMHFTWTKSLLNPNATILKKIDRIIGNNYFFAKFSIANAIFLLYGISDHSTAILKIPQAMIRKRKSFRLANYITGKREFTELVKDKWNTKVQGHAMYKLVSKLKGLKQHLNKLNWKNGNLFEKVADIKTKLYNVQRNIDLDPTNKDLRNENVGLLREYKEASIYEEKLFRQKAKITWLREGDKNSAYFHKVLKGWINRNRIMSVCAEDGIRYKNCEVATQFLKHFEGFMGINPPVTKLTVDAPGPDGYTSKLYKKAWNVVKGDFCAAIKEFFLSGKLLGEVNATLISLVPKSMTAQKGFIEDILRQFGFPDLMIGWITTCISTLKFTICVNGERFGYFKGGRGLRQGDPISPYIFTMVMEMINLMVKDEIRKEKAFKFHFGCKKLRITHLCFTDDLIMFSHGDRVSVLTLKSALDKFSAISGLHPNLGKCTMFYRSLDDDTKNEICSIFPFKEGKLPMRYLGVPLVTKKIGVSDCKQLVDKVNQRLNDWKNKSVLYRKSSTYCLCLGIYASIMRISLLLPKTIINDIEKLFKKFLWIMVIVAKLNQQKEVFYAGFHDYNKVSDQIDDNGWRWPHGWIVKYPWLNMIQVSVLFNSPDKLVWVDNERNDRRNSRLFNNCKREVTDLFATMIDEIRARMVSTVKEKMALLLLGMDLSENRSFTTSPLMPATRASMLLRKENGILQDSSKPSNDNTNVVNALQEPFVVKQEPGENSSQSPPQINHHYCYGCGDPLEDIFFHQCTYFTTFSNILFDADYDFSFSDDQLFSDEDISKEIYSNPLFDEEIISIKIDPHHFNVESNIIESLLNHESSIISSSLKIDSLFAEFVGKLTLLKSIPPGINETACNLEEETRLIKRLLDILILEELLSSDSLSLPENESFHFDIPSSSRPPAKLPDGNSGILNVKVMGGISEHKVPMPRLMFTQPTLVPNQEKSPNLLPHLGHEAFQPSTKCPMMIYEKNTPILNVPFFHFYPPLINLSIGDWVKLSDPK